MGFDQPASPARSDRQNAEKYKRQTGAPPQMPRPVVAMPACIRELENTVWHCAQTQYVRAVTKVANLMTLIVPALVEGNDADALLDRVDGLIVSGSATNVHPSLYGKAAEENDGPFDQARDATSIPLIRTAIERGIPLLAICRGIQELNVALGGTLGRDIHENCGIFDHRSPEGSRDERFAIRHSIAIEEGSCIAGVLGANKAMVNSLHRQAIEHLALGLVVEARAEDGTIEAVSVKGARGFALGVQWHPEYWAETDSSSQKLLEAFGDAVRSYQKAKAT
ncbi:gamma-glutamyl-gamma-aminobutyrate hydrolase family protein [Pseudomonas sp. JG-B]|uniref:gamma-glutamyl-gamma-aminobutyrate hydrolase family protein n=1 Tax=Pseudomonas sp. JG-B TaxID=2603214 RepID=UPI001C49C9AC|nr:gamma-glutamyl-gamma-aminobutyrate hydrolase family protein [Pseudomonas sp. JG-B]